MRTNAGSPTESMIWLDYPTILLAKAENAMGFGRMAAVPMDLGASSDMLKKIGWTQPHFLV